MTRLSALFVLALFFVQSSVMAGDERREGNEEHEESSASLEIRTDDLERLGLHISEAGPANIVQGVDAAGRIVPIDGRLAHVSPRFAGVVKEVLANIGDQVKPGAPLAVIQNNQNLQTFTLMPAISGMVLNRRATVGEVVTETSVMFVVADLSEVWAELAIYKQDVEKVHVGQKVTLSVDSHIGAREGDLVFLSPLTDERTQSRIARVRLKNPDPLFSPGAFVDATIITENAEVPVALKADAIQQIDGKPTVFLRRGEHFEPMTIVPGRTDGRMTEVLRGIEPGVPYATGNTFVLKADLGKGEAEDDD